jgi:hypothetical protein
LGPEPFITFHSKFLAYAASLQSKIHRTDEDNHTLTSMNLLTSTIASGYSCTLAKLEQLISHGDITSDLVYAILIPRSLLVMRCAITGLPRIFKLTSWVRTHRPEANVPD